MDLSAMSIDTSKAAETYGVLGVNWQNKDSKFKKRKILWYMIIKIWIHTMTEDPIHNWVKLMAMLSVLETMRAQS